MISSKDQNVRFFWKQPEYDAVTFFNSLLTAELTIYKFPII